MLDYRYETFIILSETLNYTKAAQQLNLSQPAVTKHIQYLENHLEVKLVDYKKNQLRLTNEGHFLKEQLLGLNTEINTLKAKLKQSYDTKPLVIGASLTIGEFYIWDIVRTFSEQEGIKVKLLIDNTTHLLEQLDNGDIDIALVSGPFNKEDYTSDIFIHEPIVCICPPNHHLAGSKVPLSALTSETIILRETGSGIYGSWSTAIHKHGLTTKDFPKQTTVGHINLIKSLVQNGEGISFLYHMSVNEDLEKGKLEKIAITNGDTTGYPFSLVLKNNQLASQPIKKFRKLLLKEGLKHDKNNHAKF
ncbi:LysR family transcriptional regulator [Vagococcus sp. PNs007]|uniref:LysR family transcriptional regulator n=1 Tax=Vagococcus proximus TaxID=2991417 RepID=A0ABT5WYA2_9ENTE|nr:LysR family transcriptional regulator [Vagococcus proximus]MDF0478737.1 LysR family transcriptional regulator [Vagococcus proximus]